MSGSDGNAMAAAASIPVGGGGSTFSLSEDEAECFRGYGLRVEIRGFERELRAVPRYRKPLFSRQLPGMQAEACCWWLPGTPRRYLVTAPRVGSLLLLEAQAPGAPHRILLWPDPETSRSDLGDFVVRFTGPLLLLRRGVACLHASAVIGAGRAWVFAGPGGQGKSTLAAAFLGEGAQLLGDEVAPIGNLGGGLSVLSGRPVLDLRGRTSEELRVREWTGCRCDAGSGRTRVTFQPAGGWFAGRPATLGRVFILAPSQGPLGGSGLRIEALSPRQGIRALVENSYGAILRDAESLASFRDTMSEVVLGVGVSRVVVDRSRVGPRELCRALIAQHGITPDGGVAWEMSPR